jgi:hypothetical protein
LVTGELIPTKGQVKRNSHLKISRFTQHFEDKLDLNMSPLDFFKEKIMPDMPIDQIRPLLARYGCSGNQQTQVMSQLSAGQKARIVFSLICHEKVRCCVSFLWSHQFSNRRCNIIPFVFSTQPHLILRKFVAVTFICFDLPSGLTFKMFPF